MISQHSVKEENLIKKWISITIEIALFAILLIMSSGRMGYYLSILHTMRFIGLLAIICYVLLFVSTLIIDKKINYFHLFLSLSFLFSFGQSVTTLFSGQIDMGHFLSLGNGKLSALEIYDASLFVLKSIVCLTLGYICFLKKINSPEYSDSLINKNVKDSYVLRKVGWVILIISIIPTYYLLLKDIVLLKTEGYGATLDYNSTIDKFCAILQGFFSASIILIFLSDNRRTKKRLLLLIIFILYVALQLLGGSRIDVFRFIVLAITIFLTRIRRLNLKYIVFLIIGIIGVSFIFSLVSSSRLGEETASSDGFFGFITSPFTDQSLLYKVFFEAGNTQIINVVVYKHCPLDTGFCYGSSLLKMLLSIMPFLSLFNITTTRITTDSEFSHYYTDSCGLGSSIYAEAYWNFGEIGAYLFLFFIGALLAFLINKLNKAEKSKNCYQQFIIYYILYYMAFLVRSDMIEFGRSFVYYCIIPICVAYWIKNSKIRICQVSEK